MLITKRVEFDAGHRIPSHESKCRNIHGHRYVLEATLEGEVKPERGQPDDGMVVDFAYIKQALVEAVVQPWDHGFLMYRYDYEMQKALACLPDWHKTVMLDRVPTAENLADIAFQKINEKLQQLDKNGLRLVRVRLYETPNSWADCIS